MRKHLHTTFDYNVGSSWMECWIKDFTVWEDHPTFISNMLFYSLTFQISNFQRNPTSIFTSFYKRSKTVLSNGSSIFPTQQNLHVGCKCWTVCASLKIQVLKLMWIDYLNIYILYSQGDSNLMQMFFLMLFLWLT